MARPLSGPGKEKLTQELQETICAYLEMGAYDHVAARAVGVQPRTFYRWMKRGRAARRLDELREMPLEDLKRLALAEEVQLRGAGSREAIAQRLFHDGDKYRRFSDAVGQAQAKAEIEAVNCLRRAWEQDWRAALEFLKRKYPDRWSQKDAILLRGQIDHLHDSMDREAIAGAPASLDALGLDAAAVERVGRALAQQISGRLPAPVDPADAAAQHDGDTMPDGGGDG